MLFHRMKHKSIPYVWSWLSRNDRLLGRWRRRSTALIARRWPLYVHFRWFRGRLRYGLWSHITDIRCSLDWWIRSRSWHRLSWGLPWLINGRGGAVNGRSGFRKCWGLHGRGRRAGEGLGTGRRRGASHVLTDDCSGRGRWFDWGRDVGLIGIGFGRC